MPVVAGRLVAYSLGKATIVNLSELINKRS